ncbi:sigma-70 family RNA polymerase sigma factor [Mycetocola spongiae]|nr:sigma-70 family RNA polymerase sigma factor [Mycetocola spongiae]
MPSRSFPPAEHAVLRLCLVEERSTAAAARILGIPPGTVKSRLHRARTRLCAELADLRRAGPGNAAC